MKRLFLFLVAATLVTSFAGVASSEAHSGVDRREARQHARIRQGVRQGDLTRYEARRLRAGQRHIHRVERRRWMDGRLSMRDRDRLNQMQNRQSRRIHRLRHNGRQV